MSNWTFGSKFIPEFHQQFGRYPTEEEVTDAEHKWCEFLTIQGKPVPYHLTKVIRVYNEDGLVVNEYRGEA